LKLSLEKVRLILVNVLGMADGVVGEDSLIGLEMDAR
jgi:hypothetical protein